MTTKARFHINVPLDKLSELSSVLDRMDIPFYQVQNMLHLPQDNIQYGVLTGLDGQYAVNRINQHLEAEKSPHRIARYFNYMPTNARRDLLELATDHICWTTDQPPNIETIDPRALQDFMDSNPNLLIKAA